MPTTTPRNDIKRPLRSRLPRRVRVAFRWIERGLAIFGGLVALSWLTIDTSVIVSQSMSPTLQGTNVDTGDRVLTEKVSYWFRRPRRWEVITFVDNSGQKVMKRVVGLPGESVQMREPPRTVGRRKAGRLSSLLRAKVFAVRQPDRWEAGALWHGVLCPGRLFARFRGQSV